MIIQIFTRDDETGILDGEFRDGDVFGTRDDSEEGSIGNLEKKTYLFIKVPDPPNMAAFRDQLGQPEFLPAESTTSVAPVKHKSKYRIAWRQKFTAAEITLIESAADTLPDGATTNGAGTVTAGVVDGMFTVQDPIRK